MSGKNDRSLPGGGRPMLIIMALVLIAAVAGGLFWVRWSGGSRTEPAATQDAQQSAPAARPDEFFAATLFQPAEGRLVSLAATVKRQPDPQLQAREIAAAVLASAQPGLLKELRLRALYLEETGTAYADLSPAAPAKELKASVEAELLAVYALVNSLTLSMSEVRQVRFLMDGREAQTLAGHVDLSRSFVKRTDLVKQE
ncbi:MAG: GerMN domain-containing protein [Nitrospirota bacterium]